MKQNDRILFISDTHAPYHHKDTIAFLSEIKREFKPDRIVCVGDELDYHALSYHDSDPDLDSAGIELIRGCATIKQLEELFPVMDLLHSNHGSMVYRRAKTSGMPRHVLKPYHEILGVDGEKWKWHTSLILKQNVGKDIFVCHGSKKNSEVYARSLGCNVVQGHFHEDFRIGYYNSPGGLIWGMNVGCLIDNEELAFEYNKINPNRPILGTGIVINGRPRLIPMFLDSKGNWDGNL
jgi:predicted phosphodiesterase